MHTCTGLPPLFLQKQKYSTPIIPYISIKSDPLFYSYSHHEHSHLIYSSHQSPITLTHTHTPTHTTSRQSSRHLLFKKTSLLTQTSLPITLINASSQLSFLSFQVILPPIAFCTYSGFPLFYHNFVCSILSLHTHNLPYVPMYILLYNYDAMVFTALWSRTYSPHKNHIYRHFRKHPKNPYDLSW